MKIQSNNNCASCSFLTDDLGLLALLFTDVFSYCLNKEVICWHAYAEVVQTFVSFVLRCYVLCDLVQGYVNFQNLGDTSVFYVSVGCCETCPILRTHKY